MMPSAVNPERRPGFEKDKYDVSVKAGERVMLPKVRAAPRDTMILVDGFSCREQSGQGTDRAPQHIAEIIASHLG